jgi:uncharacterized protein YbbK (DUF523 family)
MTELAHRLRLGVSACLLGERVRYDGGHKRDAWLVDTLDPWVEWVSVCPEVEIGLGVPRDTLHLVGRPDDPHLVVERTGRDLTDRMRQFAEARVAEIAGLELDGYVLKRGSPSCGVSVPVVGPDGMLEVTGRGMFAAELMRRLPDLPIEEEDRLVGRTIRRRFVERVVEQARRRRSSDGDALRWLDRIEQSLGNQA